MTTGVLELKGISKTFGGVASVVDCNFVIRRGSITGLVGPNGAGKTTCFNMIAGIILPDTGHILFELEDITGLSDHKIFHKGIARTFQIPHEFSQLTVLDNLLVGGGPLNGENWVHALIQPAKTRIDEAKLTERAKEVLELIKLEHMSDRPAVELSGGQKKLLELGRSIMSGPKLLLLDEPGAGVNPTLLNELARIIRQLHKEQGYTICLIEHNMDMIADLCEPVIVLSEGRVLTEGTMEDIRHDKRVLDVYLGGGGRVE